MSKVDWSKAPEGAEFWADGDFFRTTGIFHYVWSQHKWVECGHNFSACASYEMRPTQWPTESRIEQIGQNGGDGLHYDEQREADDIWRNAPSTATHYGGGKYWRWHVGGNFWETERAFQWVDSCESPKSFIDYCERPQAATTPIKPEQEEHAPLLKYDRRIKGKHNTGTCTVDVYRVLSAFEITEPELQHCIKKLLAAGQRGAKDYQQDLKEAAASLGMLIDRLAE